MKFWQASAVSVLLIALFLTSCAKQPMTEQPENTAPSATVSDTVTTAPTVPTVPSDLADLPNTANATVIKLADDRTVIDGSGAEVAQAGVIIRQAGVYVVSGQLTDGQLRVETEEKDAVNLVLNGVSIHSNSTAPLFVRRSAKTVITLEKGSENTLSDSVDAVFEDAENEEPSGTLFSKSDLVINGEGALTVKAAFRDGIVSRDGLDIVSGSLTVSAADDALMGRDYVLVRGGTLSLTAAGDGIKSTNDASTEVGYVTLQGGTLSIRADKDGIQAQSALCVSGGTVNVTSGGGHENGSANSRFDYGFGHDSKDSTLAGKALKAGTVLSVDGGELTLDSADDGLHSNHTVLLNGGTVVLSAGDDGVHADTLLEIQDGCLTVLACYEGLEAATITVRGGDTRITASDDGINASSGSSETTGDYGPMGGDPFASDDSRFEIHGGRLYVDASGDGLDSNGSVVMTGGEVSVVGPSDNGNGTFDFGGSFELTGGTLVAIGSSGMAQTPSSDTMNSVVWGGCSLQSGDRFSIKTADGEELASIESPRTANWVYVALPTLEAGETYTLSDGNETQTITHKGGIHSIGTTVQMGGGPMGGRHPGGMRPPSFRR